MRWQNEELKLYVSTSSTFSLTDYTNSGAGMTQKGDGVCSGPDNSAIIFYFRFYIDIF